MFTDTHCHLYSEYYDSLSDIIENAKKNFVSRFFVAGCNQKSNEEVLQVLKYDSSIYGCLGIHPEEVLNYQEEDLVWLGNHLNDSKVIAIGEIGLDYHYSKENKELQKELFRKQLDLAQTYHLPVVIHSRDATNDTIQILREYPEVKGVIHCFGGSLETAKIYQKMGYKLGINGVVTFKNSHLIQVVKKVMDSIVLETDSPYLAPHPYRGTRNEPKNILEIAKFIAQETSISLEELSKITNQNIQNIFDKI